MNRFASTLAAVALAMLSSFAQAQGVSVTSKLLDYDVAHPDRENYRDTDVGTGVINDVITGSWRDLSGPALQPVREWLGGSNRLGSGMTARDIEITLGIPGRPSLAPTGQSRGRLTIPISGNQIDLTSTHPASPRRSMDPRLRMAFDMVLTIDFHLTNRVPHLRASAAILQPGSPTVSPLNTTAEIGLAVDDLLSSLGGTQSIEERIREAFASQSIAITGAFNSRLAANAGMFAMPNGFLYNGGRIEPDRILIAAYRVLPHATDRVTVLATWPKDLGTLMNDCRPVGIEASWQAGPRPYSGIAAPPRAKARIQNVNPRVERRDAFACSAVLQVAKGAPLSFAWADPVRVTVASPNPAVMRTAVVARPSGWANPVVPRAPEYALALTKESLAGIGLQRDAITHAQQSPLDPITRTAPDQRVNPVVQQPEVRGAPAPVATQTPVAAPASIQQVPATAPTSIQQVPATAPTSVTRQVPVTAPPVSSSPPARGAPPVTSPPAATNPRMRTPATQTAPRQ